MSFPCRIRLFSIRDGGFHREANKALDLDFIPQVGMGVDCGNLACVVDSVRFSLDDRDFWVQCRDNGEFSPEELNTVYGQLEKEGWKVYRSYPANR